MALENSFRFTRLTVNCVHVRDYVWKNGCLFTDVFVLIADCLFIICDHRGKEQVSMITNFGVSWLIKL